MSEENRPRYKEQIDVGPDMETADSSMSDSGRSKTNMGTKSHKMKRKGRPQAWMPKS